MAEMQTDLKIVGNRHFLLVSKSNGYGVGGGVGGGGVKHCCTRFSVRMMINTKIQ